MRVAVVAEYYPRAAQPALGVWAHRQALAARDAGAEVRVFVLHRPVPSKAALRGGRPAELIAPLRQPLHARLDGIDVRYVPFVAPPRPRSYGRWGAWAAPTLALALRRADFDLVHAHYAAPAGDAVRRARTGRPLVISAHGGDVLAVPHRWRGGREAVQRAFGEARLVLANSAGTARRAQELGAARTRVVHLGTDVPEAILPPEPQTIVTVANLVPRKRHGDVLAALTRLPEVRWHVVGDGPEREPLERRARELGIADRVVFHGALAHAQAQDRARRGAVFVMPSVDEAFGVAYVEAMAGGVPAIGCAGEDGPEEIRACGDGIALVAPRDPAALAGAIRSALTERERLGAAARATVLAHFTWDRCGRETVAAYEEALRG